MKTCEACQLEVVEARDTLVRAWPTGGRDGAGAALFHPKCWRRASHDGWRAEVESS